MARRQDAHPLHRLSLDPYPVVTISHFRHFRPDERHVTRISREYVLIFMLAGTLHFSEEGTAVSASAGEWYLQVPGLLQSASRGSPSPEYYFIHFSGREQLSDDSGKFANSVVGTSGSFSIKLPIRGTFRNEVMIPLFEQLEGAGHVGDTGRLLRQSAFLKMLAHLAGEGANESKAQGGSEEDLQKLGNERSSVLIRQVVAYLGEHVDRTVTLEELSEHFHFTPDALIRIMKRWTGQTPGRFHRFLRLEKAKWLLENTDDPLPAIGRAVGYQDVTLLHKAFRSAEGMTPGMWRKKSRGLPQTEGVTKHLVIVKK